MLALMRRLTKKRKRKPGLRSKRVSKKRMAHPLVSKQLLIKLKNIYKMILPLYIKHLKMLHPKKKVDEKFVLNHSISTFEKALKQPNLKRPNLKRLTGGSNGAWVQPDYKTAGQYRRNEDLYGDNRLSSNKFNKNEVRILPTFPILEGEPNYQFLKYLLIGFAFHFVMIQFVFN